MMKWLFSRKKDKEKPKEDDSNSTTKGNSKPMPKPKPTPEEMKRIEYDPLFRCPQCQSKKTKPIYTSIKRDSEGRLMGYSGFCQTCVKYFDIFPDALYAEKMFPLYVKRQMELYCPECKRVTLFQFGFINNVHFGTCYACHYRMEFPTKQ